MEADWEVEIGGEAAVIEAAWSGFIDLEREPERVTELSEITAFPPLGQALLRLNQANSPVWSSKCDFWTCLPTEELDPFEMEATPEQLSSASGLYIDLLPKITWTAIHDAEQVCRVLCARLHELDCSCCRIDFIVRQAWTRVDAEAPTLGLTVYLTACGPAEAEALVALSGSLEQLTAAVRDTWPGRVQKANSTLQ